MRKCTQLIVVALVLACTSEVRALGPSIFAPYDQDPGYCMWVRGEALYWFLQPAQFPPVVTSGTTNGGALGFPDTTVLYGGEREGVEHPVLGGRVQVGGWFDYMGTIGAEGGGFGLLESSQQNTYSSGAVGAVVAVPITNAAGTQTVFNAGFVGSRAVTVRTNIFLGGANADAVITPVRVPGLEINLLAGASYLNLREAFSLNAAYTTAAGVTTNFADFFTTTNNFFGGDLGTRMTIRNEFTFIEMLGRVGLGSNRQEVNIRGGGIYTQPSNIGNYNRNEFTVAPQAQIRAGLDYSSHIKMWIGYDFLYINRVVRPGEQIDTQVDLAGGTAPVFNFVNSDFTAHGANFGFEIRY